MGEPIATVGDLAGICGHDGTNWEKVLIDASKRLVVAIASAVAQDAHIYGWDGDSWRKQNLQPGYYAQYKESFGGNVSGTSETFSGTGVPEGRIRWVQCIEARNNSAAAGTIFLILNLGGSQMILAVDSGMAQYVPVVWNGNIPLKKDDYVQVYVLNEVDGRAIECKAVGYDQQIAE